jgi:CelD/BcsL family acetyltransferase involved in cellulose biosynthesis
MSAVDVAVLAPPLAPPLEPRLEPPPAPALSVETVSDYEGLLALEPAWNGLVDAAGVGHPFLSHEWIRTWWECFGAGKQLHVLVVRAGSEPVAIAPLMRCQSRICGVTVRRLQLIANEQTPRADLIVGRRTEEAYQALWDCLAAQRALWDALVLPQLPADSATLDVLSGLALRDGFRTGIWRRPSDRSPWVRLAGNWDDYFAGLARKHRSNLRNRIKRLEQLGPLEVKSVSAGPEIGPALDQGFNLEAAAWKGRGGTAIRCLSDLRLFYTRLAAWAAQRGWLRLQFLTVGERPIAFAYMLCFKKTLFLLKPGYDPAYSALSPSNVLLSKVLREAFAQRLEAFDFLGEQDRWKVDWTPEGRPHSWLFVFPDTPRSRLLHYAKFRLLPWLKQARARVLGRAAALGRPSMSQ